KIPNLIFYPTRRSSDLIIFKEIYAIGGKALMSKKEHQCGSDRIAEAVEFMDVDIVVNVQGDEPFTEKESLQKLIAVFKNDTQNRSEEHTSELQSRENLV